MLASNPARRLAGFLVVLIGMLLAWPLLPRTVAARTQQVALQRGDSEDEAPGRSEQHPFESNESREADDSESEKSNIGLASAPEWVLECERGVRRISTFARSVPHVSPGHARLERERGPPVIE
jgi:hypothetical protein